jgi:two-component system, LuxR family, sensor kinase FixL
MSYVTILWSVAGAVALLLGMVHGLVWALDRRAWANLTFSLLAVSVAGIAAIELKLMYAQTPDEWGEWVRWCQLPIFFAITGTVLFVWRYLGTGRVWLAWTIIGVRCVILVINFTTSPNFNFQRIVSLDRIPLLGEEVSVVGEAVASPLQWLASASVLLLTLFVMDAAITLWRSGGSEARRKAAIVGGSTFISVALSILFTQLMIWGVIRVPVVISLPFMVMLCAMAFELSRDILSAPRLARDLGESERRLELAASAAGLGLWAWDIVRNRVWTTDRARRLFGLSADDAIDADRWMSRVHPEDVTAVRRTVENAVASGREFATEYRVCLPQGGTCWIAARGRAERDAWGRPALMRGVVLDVTDRRKALDESDEMRRELAHVGRVTMLGQLASSIAHELSQPLAAILRNAEAAEMMLQSGSPDLEELRAIVTDIHRDDHRAGEVIDRLRTLLKRRRLEFQSIAVDGLVRDVNSLVRSDAAARRVTLVCVVAPGLPKVSGDRVHLSQVLLNLIINGMEAVTGSSSPGRSVTVAARHRVPSTIEVAVTDSGMGIPPDSLARIFEPFFTTKAGGMGMGLAISRTIVEAHGGQLWAENNTGGGATFRFTIPAAEDDRS